MDSAKYLKTSKNIKALRALDIYVEIHVKQTAWWRVFQFNTYPEDRAPTLNPHDQFLKHVSGLRIFEPHPKKRFNNPHTLLDGTR